MQRRRKESRVTVRGKVGLAETGQEGRREERRKVEEEKDKKKRI